MFVLKQSSLTFLAGAAVTLALAACNSSEAPTSMLTQSDAQSMGQELTAEVSALNEGTTYSSSSSMPVSAASTNLDLAPASTTAGCTPAKSPASPANSDGDPVPDSVRYDFAGCVVSRPTETITLSGLIDILDPTPHSHRSRGKVRLHGLLPELHGVDQRQDGHGCRERDPDRVRRLFGAATNGDQLPHGLHVRRRVRSEEHTSE